MPAPTRVLEDRGPDVLVRPSRAAAERRYRLRRTVVVAVTLVMLAVFWRVATGGEGDSARPGAASDGPTGSSASADRDGTRLSAASAGPSSPGPETAASSKTGSSTTGPSSASVPKSGTGRIALLDVPGTDTERTGRTVTFSVEAEGGLGLDLDDFASRVREVLSDERGWEVDDDVHFVAVSPDQLAAGRAVDVRITLASPDLTDSLCAPLNTRGEVSCNQGGRAVINAVRWAEGAPSYDNLHDYRTYVVNHEVGHGLGHQHVFCPGAGERAPIMLQQTLGLQGCAAWPYPVGA